MVVQAYSLLDTKTGLFSLPWFFAHDQVAIRAVVGLAGDEATTVGKYPSDYVLMCVGEFDDCTGILSSLSPRQLGVVSSLLARLSGVSQELGGLSS